MTGASVEGRPGGPHPEGTRPPSGTDSPLSQSKLGSTAVGAISLRGLFVIRWLEGATRLPVTTACPRGPPDWAGRPQLWVHDTARSRGGVPSLWVPAGCRSCSISHHCEVGARPSSSPNPFPQRENGHKCPRDTNALGGAPWHSKGACAGRGGGARTPLPISFHDVLEVCGHLVCQRSPDF